MVAKNKSRKKLSNFGHCAPRDFRMVEAAQKVQGVCEDFEKQLARCVQENSHRRYPYWILVNSQWTDDHSALRTNLIPWSIKPPKMIGTMCWYVDNVLGRCTHNEPNGWVLFKDAPAVTMDGEAPKDSQISEDVLNSSIGMPLAN